MEGKSDSPTPSTPPRWGSYWGMACEAESVGAVAIELPPLFARDDVSKLFPGHRPDADCERIASTLHVGVCIAVSKHLAAENRSALSAEIAALTKVVDAATALADLIGEDSAVEVPPYGQVRLLPMLRAEVYDEMQAAPTFAISRAIAKAEREVALLTELTEFAALPEALSVLARRAEWAAKRRQDQIGPGGPDSVLAPQLTTPWVFAHRLAYGKLPGKPHKTTRARLRNFITLAADRLAQTADTKLLVYDVRRVGGLGDKQLTRIVKDAVAKQASDS